MDNLLSFSFAEQSVRVIERDDGPWWIAADLAEILGYRDTYDLTRNLDDDEKGTHNVRPLYSGNTPHGGPQEMTIISESGLYNAIFRSRRPEARAFRRWVTGTVLPQIRRTGSFALLADEPAHDPTPPVPLDYDPTRLVAGVSVVREARRLFGPQAARTLWLEVGLPPCIADAEALFDGEPLAAPLELWLADKQECTIQQAGEGIGLAVVDWTTRHRIGKLLRGWGWTSTTRKVARNRAARVFSRPATTAAATATGATVVAG